MKKNSSNCSKPLVIYLNIGISWFYFFNFLSIFRHALRDANGHEEEKLDAKQLLDFLTKTQKFENIDLKKVESIINTCEPTNESDKEKKPVMTIIGLWKNFWFMLNFHFFRF